MEGTVLVLEGNKILKGDKVVKSQAVKLLRTFYKELAQLGTDLHNEGSKPICPKKCCPIQNFGCPLSTQNFYEQIQRIWQIWADE